MISVHAQPLAEHRHAVLWIDHREARILRFETEVSTASHLVIRNTQGAAHLHHKANSIGTGHAPVNQEYLEHIAAEIGDSRVILITGPGSAKYEFYKHLEHHHKAMLERIVALESADHPTDAELLARAAHSFRVAAQFGRAYSPAHDR